MSGETILRSRPGESVEDYIDRIVSGAPAPTIQVIDRLRDLLPVDVEAAPEPSAAREQIRTAA